MRKILFGFLLVVCMVGPAAAQDWFQDPINERAAGMVLLVFDPNGVGPDGEEGVYRTINFSDLLSGVVRFPDTYTRYVFQLEWTGATPTVDATTIQGGTVSSPGSLAIPFPDPPTGATMVALGFAIPVVAGLPTYSSVGSVNSGFNDLFNYSQQASTVSLTVGGELVDYNVWVSNNGYFPVQSFNFLFLVAP